VVTLLKNFDPPQSRFFMMLLPDISYLIALFEFLFSFPLLCESKYPFLAHLEAIGALISLFFSSGTGV
jgi:hypothetical protein